MKTLLINLSIGLVAITSNADGQRDTDLSILKELNRQFIQNFIKNDTVSHNKIIYKDFFYISSTGRILSRSEYMKEWAHGYTEDYEHFDYDQVEISIFENSALVRARTRSKVKRDGETIEFSSRYTDTYIKLGGRWWCVQAQLTPIKP